MRNEKETEKIYILESKDMSKKQIWTIIEYIFLTLLTIAIIPIDIFVISMPKWVTIVMAVILLSAYFRMIFSVAKKKKGRIVVTAFFVLTIALSIYGNFFNPYWNSLNFKKKPTSNKFTLDSKISSKKALSDLENAVSYLKKVHPLCKDGLPEDTETKYKNAKSFIKNSKTVTVVDLYRKIENIYHTLGDSNTNIKFSNGNTHYLKQMKKFKESGNELVKVNGKDIKEIMEKSKELYSYELEEWHKVLLIRDLYTLEGLKYNKIYPQTNKKKKENTYKYTFKLEDGTTKDYTYKVSDFITYDSYKMYNKLDKEKKANTSYKIDKEKSLAILTINSCKFDDEYKNALRDMFTEIKENKIFNLAIDLRGNGGGDLAVIDEFMKYLYIDTWKAETNVLRLGIVDIESNEKVITNERYEGFDFDGEIFALVDVETRGAAMLYAEYIQDNKLGTLIGERPGNPANRYGEAVSYSLSNSKLSLKISTKAFTRVDYNNPSNFIDPDISCAGSEVMDKLYDEVYVLQELPSIEESGESTEGETVLDDNRETESGTVETTSEKESSSEETTGEKESGE